MICIYDPLDTEFRGHGLGVLQPVSCTASEQAGGSYELSITMPITDDGKWELLITGAVIRAPVPQVVTPMLTLKEAAGVDGVAIYRAVFGSNVIASARYLSIRAEPDLHAAILESVPEYTEIIHTGETAEDGEWLQFVTPSGTLGWAPHWYVEYVRAYVPAEEESEIIDARQVREQLFRIYAIDQSEDGSSVSAQARHISYDQMYNALEAVDFEAPTPAATACSRVMAALENQEHGFRLLCGIEGEVSGSMKLLNGVNALLDPEKGLAAKLRARVVRDNFDTFLLPNVEDTGGGVTIRYGKNLIGVHLQMDDDGVYTRFIPLGKDAEGGSLRLPEGYIDSGNITQYSFPRIRLWEISGAQVGAKRTLEDGTSETLDEEGVYTLLREAADEQLQSGADEPVVKVSVSFIELGQTVQYADLAALQRVFLYDWVTVIHEPRNIRLRRQVCGYSFDCLQGRYTQLELGDVFADRTAGVI